MLKRSLFRWLYHLVAACSLLVLLGGSAAWIRARYATDDLFWNSCHLLQNGKWRHRMTRLKSQGLGFWFETRHNDYPTEPEARKRQQDAPRTGHYPPTSIGPIRYDPPGSLRNWFPFSYNTSDYDFMLAAPYWPLIAMASLPLAAWSISLHRRLRASRRLHKGQCVRCGYDLRASKDRCPECGAAIASP